MKPNALDAKVQFMVDRLLFENEMREIRAFLDWIEGKFPLRRRRSKRPRHSANSKTT